MVHVTQELATEVLSLARAAGIMIATAESCTGGMVAAALTDIPGSSDVFDRGFVTYSYPSKTALLDVPIDMLKTHGAVSEPVARQMALGAIKHSDARLSVAITGVAGPGASGRKPEGLVHFATANQTGVITHREMQFGSLGRGHVRVRACETALLMLRDALRNA